MEDESTQCWAGGGAGCSNEIEKWLVSTKGPCGWKSESDQFFTNINTKGGGHNQIQINSDERWKFFYEVTAENASSIKFVLEIFIEDDEVKVVRI
jgi:hypothetical protein